MEAPGVVEIVGIGRTPAPIDDREIEAVQAVLACGLAVRPLTGFGIGDKVRVERGPLRGVEGVVVEGFGGQRRLVVSISLLQRSISVELHHTWVRRLN